MQQYYNQQNYNQQAQDQQTQVRYDEPEYLIRPTWKLAWGLLWRTCVLTMPIYLVILFITLIIGG